MSHRGVASLSFSNETELVNLKNLISGSRIAKFLVRGQLALLAQENSHVPIPLGYWLACRKILGAFGQEPDLLFPSYKSLQSKGDRLEIPQLRMILAGDLLGGWALDAQTIKLLWSLLWRDTPQIILEYGSGVSTLLLAVYASSFSLRTGKECLVISLEPDKRYEVTVEQRLKENDLVGFSKILHLSRNDCGTYEFGALQSVLAGASIDLVLIDGPSGPPGCRHDTLPNLLPYCKTGTRWLLDDAFRDGELEILRTWYHTPRIKIEGIFAVGKGLAAGRVI
jgi:hypothetical protein